MISIDAEKTWQNSIPIYDLKKKKQKLSRKKAERESTST